MVLILTTLKIEHPELNLDDYRRGAAQENWALLSGCSSDSTDERLEVADALSPDDLRPASQEATDPLRHYLIQMSGLPRSPASAPSLVLQGDQDQLIPVPWTDAAVQRACDMGADHRVLRGGGAWSRRFRPDRGVGLDAAAVPGGSAGQYVRRRGGSVHP